VSAIQQYDFGTTGLLIDEARFRATILVLTEPDDDICDTGTELDGISTGWLIALAELRLHHPEAALDPEPDYVDGVEIFTAAW
jgi:hypothetical protein